MSGTGSTRRDLLRGTTLGLAGAAVLQEIVAARGNFRATLDRETGNELGRREDYDLSPEITYLNHAAIGCVPRVVREALREYQRVCEENPWLYVWGGAWNEAIEETRTHAAALLGCSTREVALTHNTTEAFNHLANGLPLGPGDEVLFSSLNHVGASRAWEYAASARGYSVRRFDFPVADVPALTNDDVVELHAAEITERTKVLVLPHVDNVVGVRHPLREITRAARERGVAFVAVDGAQSVGMLPVDVAELGVDFYATSGHKWLQSPKGLGLFYAREELIERTRPMWVTWGHDQWKGTARVYEDYGTRDPADVLALDDALAFQAAIDAAERERHHRELRALCRERVEASARLAWRSPASWEAGGALYTVGFEGGFEGRESPEVARELFETDGFVVRPFARQGLNAIRISPNLLNGRGDVEALLDALEGLLG